MSKYNYKKVYFSEIEYNIFQVRKDSERKISEEHHDYQQFLAEGNEPEIVPYTPPSVATKRIES